MMKSHDGPRFATLLDLVPVPPDWRLDWSAIWPLFAAFAALDHCPQDPVHHAEGDAGTHTRMVVEALVAQPDWRQLPEAARRWRGRCCAKRWPSSIGASRSAT